MTPDNEQIKQANAEGISACAAGRRLRDNPYTFVHRELVGAWITGYLATERQIHPLKYRLRYAHPRVLLGPIWDRLTDKYPNAPTYIGAATLIGLLVFGVLVPRSDDDTAPGDYFTFVRCSPPSEAQWPLDWLNDVYTWLLTESPAQCELKSRQ